MLGTLRATREFLSTPSARRATGRSGCGQTCHRFLSTPSARRATLPFRERAAPNTISIHALREEGDSQASHCKEAGLISIHALREEGDVGVDVLYLLRRISIHALREEGDHPVPPRIGGHRHFYPRPPRGGRLAGGRDDRAAGKFLSTPSARRATRWPPILLLFA